MSSLLRFLASTANAPFTIVGGIAIVFAAVQASGVLGLLGDHDVDADADADADVDGDADADGEHDAEADGDDHAGVGDAIFAAFGIGRLPLSIVWQTWSVIFAITGLALNARFLGAASVPLVTLAWTVPAGLVSGGSVVALLTRLLGPVFSTKPHEATSRAELVGLSGVVISSKVDKSFGEVRIRDKSGHDLRVVCKLAPGVRAATEREQVVVVDYEGGQLYVAPVDGVAALNAHT
jgi:membrane protein implicated in regulation of membrane protease activity